jgi:N-methylhydantoinase A/oxoprolinase/acetone carboxylase beta subunit
LLLSDLKRVYQKTAFTPVTRETPALVKETFARMAATAEKEFEGYGHGAERIQWERSLEMRYRGQGYELPITVDLDRLLSDGRGYLDRSFDTHPVRYGTTAPTDDIELVNYRLVAGPGQDALALLSRKSPSERGPRVREAFSSRAKQSCPFIWRSLRGYHGGARDRGGTDGDDGHVPRLADDGRTGRLAHPPKAHP